MDVEITLLKGDINWTQSRIILLFNKQKRAGGHTPEDLFPLEQVTLWALQIALMIGIRSNKPEEYLLHYCPLTRYETTLSGHSSYQDIPGEACTIVRVTARATGDSSNTERTPFYPVGQSMAKGSSTGIVTGQDIINDPLAALLFKTLTSRTQGNMMYEQAFGGTVVALARIPKNIRCQKDSKKNITPRESRISIRTPDQEVGLIHSRAADRLEQYGLSPLQKGPSIVNALRNIQTSLNPALRPLMNTSTRDLSQLTSRQIAKQTSNHCKSALIEESVCKIIRTWVDDGDSPLPISLGPIERDLSLFNLNPTKGKTQECVDSPSHRLLLGAMSFIFNLEPGLSVDSACEIYHRLVMNPIQDPTTNIRLAWAAARLMTWLLLGLCHCSSTTCSCANTRTRETLRHLAEAQTMMYCRERARSQDHATVSKQFQIGATCFARPMACQAHPCLMVGELGIFKGHRTIHEDLTASVYFQNHGLLEILMDSSVITLLEAQAHWTETGPEFTLGDMISSLATPVTHGVVHGFVTQADGTIAVLIWTDTDRYAQYRPDQIQRGPLGLLALDPLNPVTQNAGTCLSGCTLLASASGGIPMREVRPGTFLLNAKGKRVKVTNVYFSRESTAMVKISANCHTTLTHPLIDTKPVRRQYRNWPRPTKFVTTAAEWHTRRHTDIYRFPPPDAPHPMCEELHPSSPHNLRRSGDMWGFSTAQNQAVRSFDDSSCLICPIGHIGWAQVDIAKAFLSCWGRT